LTILYRVSPDNASRGSDPGLMRLARHGSELLAHMQVKARPVDRLLHMCARESGSMSVGEYPLHSR
jgi:hypothetical protein